MASYTVSLRKGKGNLIHNARLYALDDYIPNQVDISKTPQNIFYSQPLIIADVEDLDENRLDFYYQDPETYPIEKEQVYLKRIRNTDDLKAVIDYRLKDYLEPRRQKVLQSAIERSKKNWLKSKKNKGQPIPGQFAIIRTKSDRDSYNRKKKKWEKTHPGEFYPVLRVALNSREKEDLNKGISRQLFGKNGIRFKELIVQIGSVDGGQPNPDLYDELERKIFRYLSEELHPDWIWFGDGHRDEAARHAHFNYIPLLDLQKERRMRQKFPELDSLMERRKESDRKRREGKGQGKGKERGSYEKLGIVSNNDRALSATINPDTGRPFLSWREWRKHVDDKITELMLEMNLERTTRKQERKVHLEMQVYNELREKSEIKLQEYKEAECEKIEEILAEKRRETDQEIHTYSQSQYEKLDADLEEYKTIKQQEIDKILDQQLSQKRIEHQNLAAEIDQNLIQELHQIQKSGEKTLSEMKKEYNLPPLPEEVMISKEPVIQDINSCGRFWSDIDRALSGQPVPSMIRASYQGKNGLFIEEPALKEQSKRERFLNWLLRPFVKALQYLKDHFLSRHYAEQVLTNISRINPYAVSIYQKYRTYSLDQAFSCLNSKEFANFKMVYELVHKPQHVYSPSQEGELDITDFF